MIDPTSRTLPDPATVVDRAAVRSWLSGLQTSIVAALEQIDGHKFRTDPWRREAADDDRERAGRGAGIGAVGSADADRNDAVKGSAAGGSAGEGITRVLEDGNVFERAGVLFSDVRGARLPPAASARRADLAGRSFEAMGVSLVLHPRNPYIPIVHMNVRFFAADAKAGESEPSWWFGGGMDLTPIFPFEKDVIRFHSVCRQSLDPFGKELYPRYKRWCDEYFFLRHRNEARGVGGIFFDDLNEGGFARCFALLQSVGSAFIDAYVPIVLRHRDEAWGERERAFQALRRGRYVEFNLILDRGTLFGLQSGGRAESILCSMPPSAQWRYDWRPEPDSPEARLAGFLVARDWI